MKSLFFLLLLLLIPWGALAFQDGTLIHLTADDGLSQNLVFDIEQDRHGFLWIGTKDGLNRYDGYEFEIFRNNPSDSSTISSNYVTFIQEDDDGTLWVQSEPGSIQMFDPNTNTFTRLSKISEVPADFSNSNLNFITGKKSTGWWATLTDGLFYISGDLDSVKEITPEFGESLQFSNAYRPQHSSRLYLTTSNQGVLVYDVSKSHFEDFTAVNQNLQHPAITHITRNKNGDWILAGHNTLYLISEEGELRSKLKISTTMNDAGVPFEDLQIDHENRIWIVRNYSLYEFLPDQNKLVEFETPGMANSLFIDRSGIFWIGSSGYGLYKFNPKTARFGFINKNYREVMAPGFDDSMQEENYFGYPVIYGDIFSVEPISKTERWVLSRRLGLIHHDSQKEKVTRYPVPIPPNGHDLYSAFWMEKRNDSPFEILFTQGLVQFDPEEGVKDFIPLEILFPEFTFERNLPVFEPLTVLKKISQTYWIGSTEHGLSAFNVEDRTQHTFRYHPGDTNTISSNHILSISEDIRNPEKYIWVGTDGGGLDRIDLQTGDVRRITEQDGLPSNVIYAIYPDSAGFLWMSSNKGIIRFDPETFEIMNFTRSDGLQSNEFNRRKHYQFEDGRILFCGSFGCNLFDPNEITLNPSKPIVSFTDISVMNRSVLPYGSGWFTAENDSLKTLRVDWNQNIIGFEFAALEFSGSDKNRYKYRIPPFLDEWTEIGSRREISFTNLDPGAYILEVLGSNNDGTWSEKPARMAVQINPPFWMTTSFRALIIIVFSGMITWLVWHLSNRKYSRELRELEYKMAVDRERLRISRDMHDDLGARLTQIRLMSEFATAEPSIPQIVKSRFKDISEETKDLIQHFREIVWSLNPQNDTLNNLADFMISYAENFCRKVALTCRLNADEEFPEIVITSNVRHNLLSVLKEALNNAAKYAHCSEISVQIHYKDHEFELSIKDNGIGFEPGKIRHTGQGLQSMEKRMHEIGGSWSLKTKPKQGTSVIVRWPVPHTKR